MQGGMPITFGLCFRFFITEVSRSDGGKFKVHSSPSFSTARHPGDLSAFIGVYHSYFYFNNDQYRWTQIKNIVKATGCGVC